MKPPTPPGSASLLSASMTSTKARSVEIIFFISEDRSSNLEEKINKQKN